MTKTFNNQAFQQELDNAQGPTVLPILFAAVVGRACKASISWRLEAGGNLGTLDLLATSTSFANAIFAQISLRSISIIGCAMAAIWAFSPVGGQASLRIMTIGSMSVVNATSFGYIPANNSYYDWVLADGSYLWPTATGLYIAALLAPARIKESPMDLWSNVKIPSLEDLLELKSGAVATSSWMDVPAENVTYTSLVGIPVSGVNASSGATNFTLETSYWRLQCSAVEIGKVCAKFLPNTPARCRVQDGIDWSGASGMASLLLSNSSDISDPRDPICDRNYWATDIPPRDLIYAAWPMANNQIDGADDPFNAHCTIETSWVELDIRCQIRDCAVKRIRRSLQARPPPGWTFLDDTNCTNWQYFTNWFTSIGEATSSGLGTLPQGYLSDPNDPTLAKYNNSTVIRPGELAPNVFARRLGQLMNTWWMVSIARETLSSGVSGGLSGRTDPRPGISDLILLRVDTASGDSTQEVPVIKCRQGWFVALLLTSMVLLLAGAIPPIVRAWARAPAFTLLVSTLLRDTPYFDAPEAGSTLDSTQRSRLLKQRAVRLGDVMPKEPVGHLAIGAWSGGEEGEQWPARVQKGRLYA